ncbi:6-phosphogluconolactonase [Zhengella mangrovi]|uniref:6-phosphogluconolactonase n=1 Tax=Zhengella mangrovi TaxID=1982044 RepID=A0A2G1QL70_9HYPH|nr:6-phosphogluconolactonase [Zhengella mangrovi]PHP66277.1 6-phosphogluconolactonase [Zhengella mangrovi]
MAREHLAESSPPAGKSWHEFAGPDALARTLARRVAGVLSLAVEQNGHATLAVSGGSTPARFFDCLADEPIAWNKVTVTLVDERFVPMSSNRSNAKLVTMRLLQKAAARACFEGLYEAQDTVEQAALAANARLMHMIPPPFDVVVLGMGTDGHTASFFPDAAELKSLLDPAAEPAVRPVHAQSADEDRLTWNLAALTGTSLLVLHIEGLEKKDVLLKATETGAESGLPIAAIFEHAKSPVQIYWSPGGKA